MCQHILTWSYLIEASDRNWTKTDSNIRGKLYKAQSDYNTRRSKEAWSKKKRRIALIK